MGPPLSCMAHVFSGRPCVLPQRISPVPRHRRVRAGPGILAGPRRRLGGLLALRRRLAWRRVAKRGAQPHGPESGSVAAQPGAAGVMAL